MLFNSKKISNQLVYYAQQNRFLKHALKANQNQAGFLDKDHDKPFTGNGLLTEKPIRLKEHFEIFEQFKLGPDSVYRVPLAFDVYQVPIIGSVLDLDYHKWVIDPSSERIQFVKRNVYLKTCFHQYSIVDENIESVTIETPQDIETRETVYLFPTKWHSRDDVPDRLAPLKDFKNRRYCVRHSYRKGLLLIEPLDSITYNDMSEDLLYNRDFDRLCDADHEAFYGEQYPECFQIENAASVLDSWF